MVVPVTSALLPEIARLPGEDIQVACLDCEDFVQVLERVGQHLTFMERVECLKEASTCVEDSWDLWVDWKEGVCVYITLEAGDFRGHALAPEALGELSTDEYLYLKIFEWLPHKETCASKPLIECRFHPSGRNAELLWIQTGEGAAFLYTNVCELYKTIVSQALKPGRVWLYDDAHKSVGKYKLPLRLVRPLSSKDGGNLYRDLGFVIARLQGVQGAAADEVHTQEPREYEAAVQGLRSLSLGEIMRHMPPHMHLHQQIQALGCREGSLCDLFASLRSKKNGKSLELLCRALVHHKSALGYRDLKHITSWVKVLNEWRVFIKE